jgi:cytochrome c peroxidase
VLFVLRRVLALIAALGASGVLGAEPADAVAALYGERAGRVRDLTHEFAAKVTNHGTANNTPITITPSFRRDVHRLRDAWKDVEFLAEHIDPGSSSRLNPPPLPRVFMDLPAALTVLNPEGLQVLLEIAHASEPISFDSLRGLAERVRQAAHELADQSERYLPGRSGTALEDRQVFEAMKAQVVRVMTLGITGFDAPATERALPESRRSLVAIKPAIAAYRKQLGQVDMRLAKRLNQTLDRAVRALGTRDFDNFDRVVFIREYGNPLLAALDDAQLQLNIAALSDLAPMFKGPVNPSARNLFAADFLDPHYHSRDVGEQSNAKMIELGRQLFFDPRISGTGAQSCASCHHPDKAFTDGLPRSVAFFTTIPHATTGQTRNTPGLSYVAFQSAQFWDMRAETLERQIPHVINGPAEFGTDFLTVIERLRGQAEYPSRFADAFEVDVESSIAVGTVTKALAQYMRSLARWDSPFDKFMRGESESLDPAAIRGFNLFAGKALCATCHFAPAFNGTIPPRYLETESEVLGVPHRFPVAPGERLALDSDLGRLPIHFAAPFRKAFKTPTVRNVALTAPYMHNGSMATLEDVMDFYNAGGGEGLGLTVPNQTLPSDSLGLTRGEMDDIVAFMKALTDTTGYGGQGIMTGQ